MPANTETGANVGQRPGTNAPAHSIRKHSLKASIWRNETRNGAIYNVVLIRTYKDGEEFKDTTSLGFDDLANAAKLLLDAESWITNRIQREKANSAVSKETGKSSSDAPLLPQPLRQTSVKGRTRKGT